MQIIVKKALQTVLQGIEIQRYLRRKFFTF